MKTAKHLLDELDWVKRHRRDLLIYLNLAGGFQVVGWLLFVWFPWIWVFNAYVALTSLPAIPQLRETEDSIDRLERACWEETQ